MSETRTFFEGALRWIQASGTATTAMVTASAAPSALVGYVQAGVKFASARTVTTIMDRGVPMHHKWAGDTPPELTFTVLAGITANNPALRVGTASGASMPLLHFEIKSDAPEQGSGSALYYQFRNCTLVSDGWTEAEQGNQIAQTWRAISMFGPTASGYLG